MQVVQRGFTLVELLIAVVLVGILATLAAPPFQQALERVRADSEMEDLVRALNLARLEAITRSRDITLSAAGGWGGTLQVQAGNVLIRQVPGMEAGAEVETSEAVDNVVFNNLGGLVSPAAGLQLTYNRGAFQRVVSVCPTGRIVAGGGCQ